MPKPVGQRPRTVPYRTSHGAFNALHESWMPNMVRRFSEIRALNIPRGSENPGGTLREDELNTLRQFARRSSPTITITGYIGPPAGVAASLFAGIGNAIEMRVRIDYRNAGPAGRPLRVIRFVRAAKIKRTLDNEIQVFHSVPGYVTYLSTAIEKGTKTAEEWVTALKMANLTAPFDAAWAQAQWEFDGPSTEFHGGMRTTDDPGDNFAMRPYILRTQFVTVLYNEALSTILEVGVSDSMLSLRLGTAPPALVRNL
jgi:hypothetical protein